MLVSARGDGVHCQLGIATIPAHLSDVSYAMRSPARRFCGQLTARIVLISSRLLKSARSHRARPLSAQHQPRLHLRRRSVRAPRPRAPRRPPRRLRDDQGVPRPGVHRHGQGGFSRAGHCQRRGGQGELGLYLLARRPTAPSTDHPRTHTTHPVPNPLALHRFCSPRPGTLTSTCAPTWSWTRWARSRAA